MYIESEQQLRELYAEPKGRAKAKQLPALESHSIAFIERSPFVVLATHASDARIDCSPPRGEPGFVEIIDEQKLLIPDGKGNNRLDSLINITQTGKIGCLFPIPGVDETLRVNGRARISAAPPHLKLFDHLRNRPKTCIEVEVEEVFLRKL